LSNADQAKKKRGGKKNKTKKPLKNAKINTCRWWKIRNGGGLGGFPNHKREYFPAQHAFRRWCVPLFLETISLASGRYTIHIPYIYIYTYIEGTPGEEPTDGWQTGYNLFTVLGLA